MEQEKIFMDAAEQETMNAGVDAILKRWENQRATEENYKAMQKEVCDFCRYWLFKHGTPAKRIKAISTVCKIELTEVKKMKRTHRLRKKLLKKRFPFSDEWMPRRTGYRERLHSCPVCGKSRRSGYYECCASCFWVFEWQDKVRGLIAQASDMMKPRGASLGVAFYTPSVATIGLTIRAFCDPEESARYQREGSRTTAQFDVNLRARDFRTSTRISLLDLRNAREPKKIMLDEILELFEKSQKEMNNYIDRNGKMATICGVPVPAVGGSWGEPKIKDHAMFVRR